jgi:predicted DNA-binding ribbon-helix-helix protein
MKSPIAKRSVVVAGHKSSVSLEVEFWNALKEIASLNKQTLSEIVDQIDMSRGQSNLSSAIRLFVLAHYQCLQPTPSERSKVG